MNVFVYGTLMKGQRVNDKLDGARYLGRGVLRDYRMFSLGSYPGIQPYVGGSVVGELYEIDEVHIAELDRYEGEGELYRREIVEVFTYANEHGYEPFVYPRYHKAYVYIYNGDAEQLGTMNQMWGVQDDEYIWYASYGSNIDEDRFLCYLEGGKCAANGKTYDGCDDKSRWIEEDIALYPGTVYASNNSPSWKNKGVAFYDEKGTNRYLNGFAFMKLYKIRWSQLLQIQRQEGRGASWYGRIVAAGVHSDGVPVYTFTSVQKGQYSEPDVSYVNLIRDAIRREIDKARLQVHDFGLETALILMARNPRYDEKPEDKKHDQHPYRLFCPFCFREEKDCTCKQEDPFRYRFYPEIDEDMFDAVKLFNQKGYRTVACCQGDISRSENRISYSSYISFADGIPAELTLEGIAPEFVKTRGKHKKDNTYGAIYLECDYRIGKTNADAQEEKVRCIQESAKEVWLKTAKAWPDRVNK